MAEPPTTSPYGAQCGIGYLWHHMDWLLRVDAAVLGIMLAYTLVLVVRVSRSYRSARDRGVDGPAGKRFVAELKAHVRSLKAIAFTAPYLGLLGTCVGILGALTGVDLARYAYEAWVPLKTAAAIVPCAVAIVVAVPATCGYTYGGTRLDLLIKGLPRRSRLARPFTEVTSFGLITAWLLVTLIKVFVLPVTPVHYISPKGFDVGIASVPCNTSDRFIALRISNRGAIFVNEEEQDWRSLQSRLSEIYRKSAYSVVYLSAAEGVSFRTVADAIDIVRSVPENISVRLVTPGAVNADCPEPRLAGRFTPHPSR